MKCSTLAVSVLAWAALATPARALPSSITYQGSLKQLGVPASGSKNMLFRLTNADGTQVYWSSGNMAIVVNNGLFSAHISPTGVDWENVAPYMEVSVEGQLLLPREPVASAPYALVCGAVANESGMIAMFAGNCPAGWTRFTALDNAFPMGGAAYGATGGAATHNHTLVEQGAIPAGVGNTVGVTSHGGGLASWAGGSGSVVFPTQDTTTAASNLPPYLTVVFCQRQ